MMTDKRPTPPTAATTGAQTGQQDADGIFCPPRYQTDPALVTRIALVSATHLFVFSHADPRRNGSAIRCVASVPLLAAALDGPAAWGAALAAAILDSAAQAVWLVPTGERGLPAQFRTQWPQIAAAIADSPELAANELSSDGQLAGLRLRRRARDGREVGPVIGVYALWVNDAWGIWQTIQGDGNGGMLHRDIAEGLALAAFTLGAQLRFSPSATGLVLLRQELAHWEARNGVLSSLSDEWRERLEGMRPSYAVWRAPMASMLFLPDDLVTLHSYDRNSSFVSSAREVGVGDPLPTAEFQPSRPGVYRLTAWHGDPMESGRYTPGPFLAPGTEGDYPVHAVGVDVWAWEPQIRHAQRVGYEVEIAEGYYWPKRNDAEAGGVSRVHDLFRPWQARLWDARHAVQPWTLGNPEHSAGAVAERIIKTVGVSAIGRLVKGRGRASMSVSAARAQGLRILRRETDADGELTGMAEVEMPAGRLDLQQPGWWATIIANANERLWSALYSQARYDTVLAYQDALYTLNPHPLLAGPRHAPGGWREQARFTVRADALAPLDALGPRELVKALARLRREHAQEGVGAALGVTHGE